MPKFLIFQLYGFLSSWGDIAVGEVRPSYPYPSKSAIMGLIAGALGLTRESEKDVIHRDLSEKYGFAVCAHSKGDLMQDFHTIQQPSQQNTFYKTRGEAIHKSKRSGKLATLLSYREYYMDAFYKIALWKIANNQISIEDIQQALNNPKFCLYLGRKSCPLSLPLNPQIMSGSLKKSFDDYSIDSKIQDYIKPSDVSYYWDKEHQLDDAYLGLQPMMTYTHRDHVRSRHKWQFSNREEFYYRENKLNNDKQD